MARLNGGAEGQVKNTPAKGSRDIQSIHGKQDNLGLLELKVG